MFSTIVENRGLS